MAILIEDAWQRRGLGPLLVARLAAAARDRRVAAFTATTLGDNRPVLRLAGALFAGTQARLEGGEYQLRLRLDALRPAYAAPR